MSVLDKIASLQRLAVDEAASPSEAANAAAAAAELMRKHRLSQADVDDGPILWHRDAPLYTMGQHVTWKRHLAVGLAKLNGCRVVLSNGTDENWKAVAKATVVGQQQKVELVRHLYQYLRREIDRMARRLTTSAGGAVAVRRERESFRLGATMAVLAKLRLEAVPPVSGVELDRWCSENVPQTKKRSKSRQMHDVLSEALVRGINAGREIPVRKTVAG